jgi:hypothetical protein
MAGGGGMETQECVVVNSFSEDCGEGNYEDERTSFDPTDIG